LGEKSDEKCAQIGQVIVNTANKRMCPAHEDQEIKLYCKQCQRLECYQCNFESHRNKDAVKVPEAAAEKKPLVPSLFESVRPRIAQLKTRLAKIGEEQKLIEHERLSIAAAIDAAVEQSREAVTARQRQLQQDLAQYIAAKTSHLHSLQRQFSSSLEALVQLAQDVESPHEPDLAVLDVYVGLLSAVRQGEEVDESFPAQSRLVAELDVSMLIEGIGQWGSVSDLPPVQGVAFDQGSVSWSSLAGAMEYEVQMARVGAVGERQGDAGVDVKADADQRVYQGSTLSCEVSFLELGEFAVRVRARFEKHGWGPFSSLATAAFEFPPVRDVAYADGVVRWSGVEGVSQYDVQLAGPIEEKKEDKAEFRRVYQGAGTSWVCSVADGQYRVRIRARHRDAVWGPFSQPVSFHKGMEWSALQQAEEIELISGDLGLKRQSSF